MAVAQSQKRQEADIGSLQPTGCPKKPPSTASWLLLKLAVEGNIPSNPVSQNGTSESAFLGHSEMCVIITWHGLGSG